MPPSSSPASGTAGSSVMLSDVISRDRSVNVFAGFARDIVSVFNRLDDAAHNSTVLAPLNSAIEALPRKPWEDPHEYRTPGLDAYEGEDGQRRAQQNLIRFVAAHIIPRNPWPEGEKSEAIWGDQDVWWEEKDGVRKIQPGDIEVVKLAGTVSNGQIWIIKGVRNYT